MFPFRKVQLILHPIKKYLEAQRVSIPQGTINTKYAAMRNCVCSEFPFRKVQLIRVFKVKAAPLLPFPFRKVQLIQRWDGVKRIDNFCFHSARYN